MHVQQQKLIVRRAVYERFKRMSEKERQAESRSVCRRVLASLPENAKVVCAYYPMPTEVDIRPLMEELLQRGCTVALPRTEGKLFTFRIIDGFDSLEKGPFRILEPTADMPAVDCASIDVILVPGTAFDASGGRLGRGSGGYDRWLPKVRRVNEKAEAWGVCFDCQLLHDIPREAHDARMDQVVTPRGAFRGG